MVRVITQEIKIEESLKKKIEFICSFCNTTPIIENGSLRTIERTNLAYVEPHIIIIKGINFLAFNYETNIYIENLSNKILIKDLEEYIQVDSIDEIFNISYYNDVLTQRGIECYNILISGRTKNDGDKINTEDN